MNKLKEFILSNKIYSKCSEQEQKAILSELERVEKLDEKFERKYDETLNVNENILKGNGLKKL